MRCLRGSFLLGLFLLLDFVPDSESERGEGDEQAEHAHPVHRVSVNHARQNYSQSRARRHDNSEHHSPELRNRVINKQLPRSLKYVIRGEII